MWIEIEARGIAARSGPLLPGAYEKAVSGRIVTCELLLILDPYQGQRVITIVLPPQGDAVPTNQ